MTGVAALAYMTGVTNSLTPIANTNTKYSSISSTVLHSRNSDCACMERLLEECMGDDWRLFRAKLVA